MHGYSPGRQETQRIRGNAGRMRVMRKMHDMQEMQQEVQEMQGMEMQGRFCLWFKLMGPGCTIPLEGQSLAL